MFNEVKWSLSDEQPGSFSGGTVYEDDFACMVTMSGGSQSNRGMRVVIATFQKIPLQITGNCEILDRLQEYPRTAWADRMFHFAVEQFTAAGTLMERLLPLFEAVKTVAHEEGREAFREDFVKLFKLFP